MIPYEGIISGHYHESSDCFEYPEKKTLLKSSHQKKETCQIFLSPPKSRNRNFKPVKNPWIIPRLLKSGESPPPPPPTPGVAKHPCFYEQMILKFSIKTELQFKILQTQSRRKTAITKNESYPRVNLII